MRDITCPGMGDMETVCLIDQAIGHALPALSVTILVLTSDITLFESDWRSCFARSIFYVPLNISGSIFSGKGAVYGFEIWVSSFWMMFFSFMMCVVLMCALYKLWAKFLN
jgi:hypothetical protein